MYFWLGTHETSWLERLDVPLFISHRRLAQRKRLPVARCEWALDSGGFTELSMHGRWLTSEGDYVTAVNRYRAGIGKLAWAAPQDWMCEPWVVEKTGLSVREHQERTVESYLSLRDRGPFIPVLQGWSLKDYIACAALYESAGVDLGACDLVGVGSVCRRQATAEVGHLITELSGLGLRLHGFGMKSAGVVRSGHLLASADSMAWSTRGRMAWAHEKCRLCSGGHRGGCANCQMWALAWRERTIDGLGLFAQGNHG